MQPGAVSLTVSLALDGTWIDIAAPARDGQAGWPPPPELEELKRQFRHLTIVDAAMRDFLCVSPEWEGEGGLVLVADVGSASDRQDVIGTETLRQLIEPRGSDFVHVAGGIDLTAFVLATGLVPELDVTLYPTTGGAGAERVTPIAAYRRLHVQPHDDGRLTTTWRRA